MEESSIDSFPQWITSAPLINGRSRVLDEDMWVRTFESPTMLNLSDVDIATIKIFLMIANVLDKDIVPSMSL